MKPAPTLAALASLAALSFSLLAGSARADDIRAVPKHPAWQNECASCHVAYPPSLLTAAGWRTVMAGLDKHFGSDASLDDKTRADITAFLVRHAGTAPRHAAADGRITGTPWFRHEHDEVPARVWRTGVKSAAQCQACHTHAAQGDYDEDGIRLPRPQAPR